MGGVMAAVPGVEAGGELDGHAPVLRVDEAALPLLLLVEGLEEHDPAGVEGFDEVEGPLDGSGGVAEVGPDFFVVGLDSGPVLGECELHAEKGVHVGVGDVVDELADGPAAIAIRSAELVVVEILDGVAEMGGEIGEDGDGGEVVIGRDGLGTLEFPDGVAGIKQLGRHGGAPVGLQEEGSIAMRMGGAVCAE